VASLVWAVTGVGWNRKTRNADAHMKMLKHPQAIPLKLCDRIANGRRAKKDNPGLFSMYRKEYSEFRTLLRREAFCAPAEDLLWAELDRIFR
jgi:guanosine-3',5'-bis(diphosphate) 3'-pyrophosphohydrolase